MSVVYHEDLAKHVENKYLAVNIIAKRARELNETVLATGAAKQKFVVVATQELIDGELEFKKGEEKPSTPGLQAIFGRSLDADEWRDTFNPEVYDENETDSEDVEPEEGL